MVVLLKYKYRCLIKTDGGVLSSGGDADIGTANKLVGGKAGAHGAGESNNDNNGVGGRISAPFLVKGLLLEGVGVLGGSGAHEPSVGHTVTKR